MKKLLSLLLAVTLMSSLVACGGGNNKPADNGGSSSSTPGNTQTQQPSGEAPKPSNDGEPIKDLITWSTAGSNELENFMMLHSESAQDLDVLCNAYSGLLEVNNKGQLQPAVATEWGSEDGGLTWTFKLRNDVTWVDVDGNFKANCTAQDWLTALEWIMNFHKNSSYNTSMPNALIKGAKEYYDYTKELSAEEAMTLKADGKFAEMVGIEAPDDYTLIYHCSKNAPYFDTLATSACLYPISQAEIDEKGVENMVSMSNETMWYNGPYTITSYIQNNEKTLTKNESYWDKDCYLFDTVTIKMLSDGTMDDQMFETGEMDQATLNEATLKRVHEDVNHDLHDNLVEARPKKYSYQFHWNFAKNNEDGTPDTNFNKAIGNEAFRLSLTYGLDLTNYWALTNTINPQNCENLAYTMQGLLYFSDGTDYTTKVIEALGYGEDGRFDMAKAQEYKKQAMTELAAEGVSFPVEFDYYIKAGNQTALDNATIVKEIFEALGTDYITLNICTYVSSTTQEVYKPSLQSFTINGWGADYGDAENFIGQELYGNDDAYYSNNYSNINNSTDEDLIATYKEFTALGEKAAQIYDDMDARYQAYVDAEVYMIQHGLVLPCSYSVVWQWTNINDYSRMNAMYGAQNSMYKNWETSNIGYTTEEYEQFKAEFYK
ncbi:MAG: hypothetical protein IKC03_06650 [Oscillospiraceae bacterium]|nr:hypothetical protein [Oscillospiraceae bacterium]